MASISHDGNGSRRILFFNKANERKAIRLGKVTKRDAESFKGKLESLLSAKMMGNSPDRETSLWLSNLDDDLHTKLAAHELVEPRVKPVLATLSVFVDQFIAGRADKAPGTLAHYQRAKLLLVEFFGADKVLADVTPHDADQFRSWMKSTKKHAENTTRGHLKNSKLIFGAAVRARLIVENPFKGISTQLVNSLLKKGAMCVRKVACFSRLGRSSPSRQPFFNRLLSARIGWRSWTGRQFKRFSTPARHHVGRPLCRCADSVACVARQRYSRCDGLTWTLIVDA